MIELFLEVRDLGGRSELNDWESWSGIELTPWEKSTLVKMLNGYVGQAQAALNPDCPDPLETPEETKQRANREMLKRWR